MASVEIHLTGVLTSPSSARRFVLELAFGSAVEDCVAKGNLGGLVKRVPALIYAVLGIAAIGSVIIAYEVITLPMLRGAALAQADFQLFIVSLTLGVPVIAISLAVLGWVYSKRLPVKSLGALFGDTLAVLSVINVAVVFVGLAFSLAIRAFGLFWR